MDPVSFTASLITILAVGKNAAKAVHQLNALRAAPREIVALKEVLLELQDVLTVASSVNLEEKLTTNLATLVAVLDELEALLKELSDPAEGDFGSSNELFSSTQRAIVRTRSTFNYVRYRSRIEALQVRFEKARDNITTVLTAQILQETLATRAMLQDLGPKQVLIADEMKSTGKTPAPEEKILVYELDEVDQQLTMEAVSTESDVPKDRARNLEVRPLMYRSNTARGDSCRKRCRCTCHQETIWMSPGGLSNICGSLRLASTGGLWSSIPYSLQTCEVPETWKSSIAYRRPTWLLDGMLLVSTNGFTFVLEALRLRPCTDEVCLLSETGDIVGIDRLFKQQFASPYDVDGNGWSLLHNACFYGHIKLTKYLCDRGANPQLETQVYETPRDKAMGAISNGSAKTYDWPAATIEEFDTFFDVTSWIQEQSFGRPHEVILGFRLGDLAVELEHCTAKELEAQDAKGRTPLWWSVSRGTIGDTRALLRAGADVMKGDYGN